MNRVLFDGTSIQSSSRSVFHGGGEYAKFMLNAAIEHNYDFDIVLSNKRYTDEQVLHLLSEHNEIKIYKIDNKQEIYHLIEENKYEIFYSALPASYKDYNGSAKLIGVIHGLRGAELPWDYFRYKYENNWKQRILGWGITHCQSIWNYLKRKHVENSHQLLMVPNAKFITVSNHTKYALLSFYPELRADNIQVFYSPFNIKTICITNNKGNYFLMVSGNRFEKNVYRAVKTFDKLFSDGRLGDKKVVITGCGNQPFWKEIKNNNKFELLPYVSTEDLEQLYEQAFCFVYPSLNEGFGYPPLKAMSYGTPVIASSATSIPEVCDDAACYFSPINEDDLAARILRLTIDDDYRNHLAKRGLQRVRNLQKIQQKEIDSLLQMIFIK